MDGEDGRIRRAKEERQGRAKRSARQGPQKGVVKGGRHRGEAPDRRPGGGCAPLRREATPGVPGPPRRQALPALGQPQAQSAALTREGRKTGPPPAEAQREEVGTRGGGWDSGGPNWGNWKPVHTASLRVIFTALGCPAAFRRPSGLLEGSLAGGPVGPAQPRPHGACARAPGQRGSGGAGLQAEALPQVSPRKSNVSVGVRLRGREGCFLVAAPPKGELAVVGGTLSLLSFTCASGRNPRVDESRCLSLVWGRRQAGSGGFMSRVIRAGS